MPDFSDPNFDFDEAQKALERKRKTIAAMLARPAAESGYKGKYYVPPYEQLQKAIIDAAGAYDLHGLDTQGADLATAKNDAISKWLGQRPEDQPEQTEQVGTGPLAPPPGSPGVEPYVPPPQPPVPPEANMPEMMGAGTQPAMEAPPQLTPPDTPAVWEGGDKGLALIPRGVDFTPNRKATPLIPAPLTKVAEWAGRGNRFGGVMDDFAKKALEYSVTQPERSRLAREAAQDRNDRQQAMLIQQKEIAVERARIAQQEADRRLERDQTNERFRRDKLESDRRYDQQVLELKQMRAEHAAGMTQGTYQDAGTTLEGNPVLRNNKRPEDQVEIKDGVRVPYTGPVVLKGEEKDVKGAMAAETEARVATKLATTIATDKEIFSPTANFGATVSTWLGGFAKEELSGLTPEQLGLRGVIGRDFAETTKRLYGASFTSTEQTRANGFTPQSNDSNAVVVEKLQGAAQFAREMAEKYGTKVQQAAMKRLKPEGAPAAPAAAPGGAAPKWGKAEKEGK